MEDVRSFEFKKGVRSFYHYDKSGNIKILCDKKWISLKVFASKYAKVKGYNK